MRQAALRGLEFLGAFFGGSEIAAAGMDLRFRGGYSDFQGVVAAVMIDGLNLEVVAPRLSQCWLVMRQSGRGPSAACSAAPEHSGRDNKLGWWWGRGGQCWSG